MNPKTADRVAIVAAAALSAVSIGLFAWDARPTFIPLNWPPRAALARARALRRQGPRLAA